MKIKIIFLIVIAFVLSHKTISAMANEFNEDIKAAQRLIPNNACVTSTTANVHTNEMTSTEAYSQLCSLLETLKLCFIEGEDDTESEEKTKVLDFLSNQKKVLLASEKSANLAFEAVIRYGTLGIANEYIEDFSIWYHLNKDCFLRIWKDRGRGSEANGADDRPLFLKALKAAVQRKDSKTAIEMTDFMFDQLWLGLHIWPQDSVSFFYDVFAVACEHEKQAVADYVLQRWLSISQIVSNTTTLCVVSTFFYPFTFIYSAFFYDLASASKVATEFSFCVGAAFTCFLLYGKNYDAWPNGVFRRATYKNDLGIMKYLISSNYNLPLPNKALLKNACDYLNDCENGKILITNDDSKKTCRQQLINIIKGHLDN